VNFLVKFGTLLMKISKKVEVTDQLLFWNCCVNEGYLVTLERYWHGYQIHQRSHHSKNSVCLLPSAIKHAISNCGLLGL
jgi:hypothetical protein